MSKSADADLIQEYDSDVLDLREGTGDSARPRLIHLDRLSGGFGSCAWSNGGAGLRIELRAVITLLFILCSSGNRSLDR